MLDVAMKKKSAGWTTVAFGDAVNNITERVDPTPEDAETYVGLEHLDHGSLTVRRWGSDVQLKGTKFRMRKGDVLFAKRNAYLKRVAVAPHDGLFSAHGVVLRGNPKVILHEFLPFFMQSDRFMERALEISVGSLSPTINWKTLAAEEFDLPPIEEQRRMAAGLSAAESGLDTHGTLIDVIIELRQSAIDHFTAVTDGKLERLGDHCKMQNGRPFPSDEYCDKGTLLLRPGNLSPMGYLDWDPAKTKSVPSRYLTEAADFVVNNGDVLINLTAQSLEGGFMGRVCLVRDSEQSLLNQRIGRFISFSDALMPEFLFRTLQSSRFQAHAISMCEGSKIKHLFWKHLAQFPMRVPHLEEQGAIVGRIGAIDTRLANSRDWMQRMREIKRRMLGMLVESAEVGIQ